MKHLNILFIPIICCVVLLSNIFVNIDFKNNSLLPSISLSDVAKAAFAQDENGGNCYCGGVWQDCSQPCDYGNGQDGVCVNCAFWDPYNNRYIPGLYIACWTFPGGLCTDTNCVPGQC